MLACLKTNEAVMYIRAKQSERVYGCWAGIEILSFSQGSMPMAEALQFLDFKDLLAETF